MSKILEKILNAQAMAQNAPPELRGFPYLAEQLRKAGIKKNIWYLPSCESIYFSEQGAVVIPGKNLLQSPTEVPIFQREMLIEALRKDQAGKSSFFEFLNSAWKAGVVRYVVDFENRTVIYYGIQEESYCESYPSI